MKKIEYIKGEIINGLEFIEEVVRIIPTKRRAKFKCYCGKEFYCSISDVKSKRQLSCSCYKSDSTSKRKTTHGEAHGKINYKYRLWMNVKNRCYNPNYEKYHRYGGRGITMCPEWINNYPAFKEYILINLGERPDGYSIDRINNDGNYEPNNIRWASAKQQSNNRRSNVLKTKK